ncbi:MAG TPA: histone deacetylase [Candidatus Dormibacteraeota bacterium]|nr:histone deacetylase [Candidatus Dormibacteraeota bacterium]
MSYTRASYLPSAGIVFDPHLRRHNPGPGHPEQPARISAVLDHLRFSGTFDVLERIAPRPASDDELALAHGRKYIDLARREVLAGYQELSTGDTYVSEDSFDCASRAAGCVIAAVDAVFDRTASSAFCLIRPPGHHAESNRGMGFCLFNNIAVGARYAQQRYGVERVLIADWDVHHGNGTQQIFYEDSSVFFFSTHQSPWYPGTGSADETGAGPGEGSTQNCPLPAGSGREQVFKAFREVLLPKAEAFHADLVMISAGFDSRIGDPLGLFTLEDSDFAELTELMLEVAGASTAGGLISVLEGGYNLTGLASAADAHISVLAGRR